MRIKSSLEQLFYLLVKANNVPMYISEYKFHPARKFRADCAYPDKMILIELEGGVFNNGRHVRPMGFTNDCEKQNCAALLGYRVLKFTTKQVESGYAIEVLKEILK